MKKLLLFFAMAGLWHSSYSQLTVKISAGGPVTFCSGGNVVLTGNITPPGTYTYQWVRNTTNVGTKITYTASVSGIYFLKVTDSTSTVYYSDSITVTVNPLPAQPGIKFDSPALLCDGNPIAMADTVSTNVSYQWYFNGSPVGGAISSTYVASAVGAYSLIVKDLTTSCQDTSTNVTVGQLPYIDKDTITYCGSATLALTKGSLSFSVLPAVCNADMRTATIVTGTTTGGGGATKLICTGGSNTVNGSGSGKYFVDNGGSLTGFGGGGVNTGWVKPGGTFNYNSGGGGSNFVYYEQGAIINTGGTIKTVECPVIGVLYPTNVSALCDNLRYLWSNGDTTASITVSPSQPTVYFVTVFNGRASCMDSILVIPETPVSIDSIGTYIDIHRSPITLNGNPPGGTFSGPGITGDSFDPMAAGLGPATLTYTYTSPLGCTNSASLNIIVYDSTLTNTNHPKLSILQIYPNPAKAEVVIDCGNNAFKDGLKVTVFNALGQNVFTTPLIQRNTILDISLLGGKGIYILNVSDAEGNIVDTKKLEVQ